MLDTQNPEEVLSTKWDGRPRKLAAHLCDKCGVKFYAPRHAGSKFCSKKCTSDARRVAKVEFLCSTCGRKGVRKPSHMAKSRSRLYFCDRKCKEIAQRLGGRVEIQPDHYGSAAYNKKYLLRVRGHRCEECKGASWFGRPMPLEVHHVDGNRTHNQDANLQLLCPNCHSFTPNYGGRNIGAV